MQLMIGVICLCEVERQAFSSKPLPIDGIEAARWLERESVDTYRVNSAFFELASSSFALVDILGSVRSFSQTTVAQKEKVQNCNYFFWLDRRSFAKTTMNPLHQGYASTKQEMNMVCTEYGTTYNISCPVSTNCLDYYGPRWRCNSRHARAANKSWPTALAMEVPVQCRRSSKIDTR